MSLLSSIPNADEPARKTVCAVVREVLDAINPQRIIRRCFSYKDEVVQAGEYRFELTEQARVFVVGAGKAVVGMARQVERQLLNRIEQGLVVAPRGRRDNAEQLEYIEVARGAHPTPDEQGARAAKQLLELADGAGPQDLVICLISGGGSSLTTLPAEGLKLSALRRTTELLLESGMDIRQVNTIRKHLSAIAGGRLAQAAGRVDSLTLVLSDVVGNPLDVIASGPMVPDPTTFEDAVHLMEQFGLEPKLPQPVIDHLREGAAGGLAETPGAKASCFEGAHSVIVGDNDLAARAAKRAAQRAGWNTAVVSTFVEGEARQVAQMAVALAREVLEYQRPVQPPACLILGGETTVTVQGNGRGGRNKELALAALTELEDNSSITVACFGTDGIDGPTDSAGAVADRFTRLRAHQMGLEPTEYLTDNDSQSFFEATGDLLVTGLTGTNVNDLYLVFVDP